MRGVSPKKRGFGRGNYDLIVGGCFLAFSLRKNVKQLVSMKRSTDDIEVLHGIRFVNAVMLLVAHKCMALMFVPYVNRTQMSEVRTLFKLIKGKW